MNRDRVRAEQVLSFLCGRSEGATSAEIARDVLQMKAGGAGLQERLVAAMLRDEERVVRDRTGRWRLRESSWEKEEVFVVGVVRQSRETREPVALSLRKLRRQGVEGRLDVDRSRLTAEEWEAARRELAAFLESGRLVTFDRQVTARALRAFARAASVEEPISIQRLGKQVLDLARHPSLAELCDRFGVVASDEGTFASEVETLVELFEHVRHEAEGRGLTRARDLLEAQKRRPLPVDFSRYAFSPAFLANLPRRPGVYVMRDREGRIIYVGKTKNLRSRVGSYFRQSEHRPAKISRILDQLYHLECTPVGSDLEAAVIEARRIREADPEVNVQRQTRPGPSRRRIEENFVAVLPSSDPGAVELFLFAAGEPLRQIRVSRRLGNLAELRLLLRRTYFRSGGARPLRSEENEDLELARRYVARDRDAIVRVNVTHCAGLRDLLARIQEEIRALDRQG